MEALGRRAGSLILLAGLLLGFLGLISYQANRAATVSTIQGAVLTLLSPAHRLVAAAWLGAVEGWQRYVAVVGATEQVAALRARIEALERRQVALMEAARENARLRALLRLRERLPGPSQGAETIGRDAAHRYHTITVNRGSRDGVAVDAVVLAPNGALVGRVVYAAPWTSMVQLVTAPRSAVGARVVRSEARGVVHGLGGPLLELAYVHSLADVQGDDLVVTSGEDGIFPPGIPIGRVREVNFGAPRPGAPRTPASDEETSLFLEITVAPAVDLRRVEEVLLLAPSTRPE